MRGFDHKAIEAKWQERWESEKPFQASEDPHRKKTYLLIEFPYPSGAGLHVGHARSFTAMDVVARKRRREGEEVLYPIGWDAFGLPTENYAIKTGRSPKEITKENTDTFRRQLKALGLSFDWDREINTTDPAYYKWTQWIFLKLFEKGLAYKASIPINWCPQCRIGLANEEVVDGACERCGTPVEKRQKEQWMLRITKYAQRLYDDLDTVNYIERAKVQQQNWIGPSEGAEVALPIKDAKEEVRVFTTRPDTIFGATYMVLAPEHPLVKGLLAQAKNRRQVEGYIEEAGKKTEFDRTNVEKAKTGVRLEEVYAINPANKEAIPIYIADYVLMGYGTGAIMAVPAHDERDFAFSKTYDIPIRKVIEAPDAVELPYAGEGTLVNSEAFNGLHSAEAKRKITEHVGGEWKTIYKLRDWVFSRQRYWGEPIPMVSCGKCGWVPLPESELPLVLPHVERYEPTDSGESPLASMDAWVETACPSCNGPARRETDTMPNWAGSSWYYLRYCDPNNDRALADPEKLQYWTPVDWYNGGMEHTVLHLLYSRFWHKFLYDIGCVPTSEPYMKRTSHGLILAEDGEKMSKSKGNIVNPDEIIERFGADSLRTYEMFMGPFNQAISWSVNGLVGARRFLERVEGMSHNLADEEMPRELEHIMHTTIASVSRDIEALKMNTAVAHLMEYSNALAKAERIPREGFRTLVLLLAPFAPHLMSELWEGLNEEGSVHEAVWPKANPAHLVSESVTIGVQVDGKVRGKIELAPDAPQEEAVEKALGVPQIKKWVGEGARRIVYVPGRILSFSRES